MLYRYKTEKRQEGNVTHISYLDELEPVPCERCGAESKVNICEGDGRVHHHGCVHTVEGRLLALCHECGEKATEDWRKARAGRNV